MRFILAKTVHVAQNTQGNFGFDWYNIWGGGWNQTEGSRDDSATYYHATIHHGHLITPPNNRHFIAAAIYLIKRLS
jgi:hypothetical protein